MNGNVIEIVFSPQLSKHTRKTVGTEEKLGISSTKGSQPQERPLK
jgi:hypothetical protein